MKRALILLSSTVAMLLAGCVSTTQNTPNPTATEQLLVSHASERAASALNLHLKEGQKVYFDAGQTTVSTGATGAATSTTTANDRYVISAVKAHLLGRGLVLVDKKEDAEVVVTLRISADSLDDVSRVLGVPAMTLPAFVTGTVSLTVPELSLLSEHQRSGITEISATAVDTKTGKLVSAAGPIFAVAKIVNRHILIGFIDGDLLEHPGIKAGVEK